MPSAKPARSGNSRSSRGVPRLPAPVTVRKALIGQVEAVAEAAHRLTPEQRALPAGLPGWDVHQLLVHIALQTDAIPHLLAGPAVPPGKAPDAGVLEWARRTPAVVGHMDEATREEAAATEDGAARIDEAVAELEPVLESAVGPDVLVTTPFGVMRMLDFTVTRLVELVVHSDDLARALRAPVTLDRQALATTVRLLADVLAAQAPGGSVEVRIPPFAVVQCVEGPRHTRGTPPNVVETDPLTWLRLATGRTEWSAALAAGTVSAGGERAVLEDRLPVLG